MIVRGLFLEAPRRVRRLLVDGARVEDGLVQLGSAVRFAGEQIGVTGGLRGVAESALLRVTP